MNKTDFALNAPGELIETIHGDLSFFPDDLAPELPLTWELAQLLADATSAVSELAGAARNLPNPHLLINPFLRREALLSSQIEGTQTSLSALFHFEAADPHEPQSADVEEVINYVHALEQGLAALPQRDISLSLLHELHHTLLQGVRGHNKSPGRFRETQVWIEPPGTPVEKARYVPPSPLQMMDALRALEIFIQSPSSLPALVRIALVHYQFEAIHPFEDGNGRIGRLLITMMLCKENLLPRPLLYLSAYFEQHRREYTDHLLAVSQQCAWVEWINFFLLGVKEQAHDAVRRVDRLLQLRKEYETRLPSLRASTVPLRLLDELFLSPVVSASRIAQRLGITPKSAIENIDKLVKAGILQEISGRQRNRVYTAPDIISILEAASI